MSALKRYVAALDDKTKWQLIDDYHELERFGQIGDCELRQHADAFRLRIHDHSTSIVLWMTHMALEAGMQFAMRYRKT